MPSLRVRDPPVANARVRSQQKRGRFDASGAVTSPAFRRKLEALPERVGGASASSSRSSDSEDAAAAFKARALAFAGLRSSADELGAVRGLIEALAALGAGEREARRRAADDATRDAGDDASSTFAATANGADQDATRVPIEPAFGLCLDVLIDVLFLPNSRPLHRAIVAAPRAFPPRARIRAEKALVAELRRRVAAARSEASPRSGAARLRVLGALFSVASCQPQTAVERRVVRAVAVDAAALIGEGAANETPRATDDAFETRVSPSPSLRSCDPSVDPKPRERSSHEDDTPRT